MYISPENRRVIDELVKQLTDEGKLVEAGFWALRALAIPQDAPESRVKEMRMAFMAGAQHLFASMLSLMDPGSEPTESDMKRMDLIHKELELFVAEMRVKGAPQG